MISLRGNAEKKRLFISNKNQQNFKKNMCNMLLTKPGSESIMEQM